MYRRRFNTRVMLFALVAVLVLTIMAPIASYAGTTGRRNTALALTGLAVYLLAKDKPGPGILAGAGAAYAWSRVKRDRRYYDRGGYYGGSSYGQGSSHRYYSRDRRGDHRFSRDRDNRHFDRGRHLGWQKQKHHRR